jgi:hypothetical protein
MPPRLASRVACESRGHFGRDCTKCRARLNGDVSAEDEATMSLAHRPRQRGEEGPGEFANSEAIVDMSLPSMSLTDNCWLIRASDLNCDPSIAFLER